MNELAVEGLIRSIQARFTDVVSPDVCFYTIPYSKIHHNILGMYSTFYIYHLST